MKRRTLLGVAPLALLVPGGIAEAMKLRFDSLARESLAKREKGQSGAMGRTIAVYELRICLDLARSARARRCSRQEGVAELFPKDSTRGFLDRTGDRRDRKTEPLGPNTDWRAILRLFVLVLRTCT